LTQISQLTTFDLYGSGGIGKQRQQLPRYINPNNNTGNAWFDRGGVRTTPTARTSIDGFKIEKVDLLHTATTRTVLPEPSTLGDDAHSGSSGSAGPCVSRRSRPTNGKKRSAA
jgi:hypothetical protein